MEQASPLRTRALPQVLPTTGKCEPAMPRLPVKKVLLGALRFPDLEVAAEVVEAEDEVVGEVEAPSLPIIVLPGLFAEPMMLRFRTLVARIP